MKCDWKKVAKKFNQVQESKNITAPFARRRYNSLKEGLELKKKKIYDDNFDDNLYKEMLKHGINWMKLSEALGIDENKIRNRFYSQLKKNTKFQEISDIFRIRASAKKF